MIELLTSHLVLGLSCMSITVQGFHFMNFLNTSVSWQGDESIMKNKTLIILANFAVLPLRYSR